MRKTLLRRGLSLALALVLGLSVVPVWGYAAENDGLCQHHPVHTDDCGYEDLGLCGHICSNDNGCITVTCAHVHVETCYHTEGYLNCSHACTEIPLATHPSPTACTPSMAAAATARASPVTLPSTAVRNVKMKAS